MRVLAYLRRLAKLSIAFTSRVWLCTATTTVPTPELTHLVSNCLIGLRYEITERANHANPPTRLTIRRTPLEDRLYRGRPEDPALHRRCPHAHIVEGLRAYTCDLLFWQRTGSAPVLLIRRGWRDNQRRKAAILSALRYGQCGPKAREGLV
jgi:hypothetical protein